jgi:signal transduction histidine kinase
MVRLIAARMNGRVWCESAQDAGSTFVFELPLARAPVAADADRTE